MTVVEMTGSAVPENGLQAFGDWVLAGLEEHADGAAEAARLVIAALRERHWDGDDVLADQFDALLGSNAMPDLRPLPVELDELAGIIEGDPMYGGGRVDLAAGEVWPAPAVDYAREIGQEDEDESDDPDKWLWVHCEGSRDGYRDMELFIGTVRDPGCADLFPVLQPPPDSPMAASVTRYAMVTLCRARHGLQDKLSAGDIAELDALAPAPAARDDLTVRTSRTVWLARKPDNRAGRTTADNVVRGEAPRPVDDRYPPGYSATTGLGLRSQQSMRPC